MSLNISSLSLYKPFFVLIYLFALVVSVPASITVWFIRRKLFNETKGCRLSANPLIHAVQRWWNGGSDRCTIGMIRHFVAGGHRVVWLTTMIDDYWTTEDFGGVQIHQMKVPLHPGDWFSQNIALGYHLTFFSDLNPDLIVVDHSASCVPMLKWRFPRAKVLFYCHFPQQLVTPSRFFVYRWYSRLIGLIEARLYESADVVMVNSKFTASQFRGVMPSIADEKIRVVYPPCDVDSLSVPGRPISRRARAANSRYTFLSMNRFWPEKRLDIILDAAAILKQKGLTPRVQLAGSVMPHIPESRIYYELLQAKSKELDVESIVEFIPSPSEASSLKDEKFFLYRQCDSALYTPPNEHFGIVPIEALEQRRPVIVVDSGGPAETVIEDVTGTKIAQPCGSLLAEAMIYHMEKGSWSELDMDDRYEVQRHRFEENFSLKGFGKRIDEELAKMFPRAKLRSQISLPPPIVQFPPPELQAPAFEPTIAIPPLPPLLATPPAAMGLAQSGKSIESTQSSRKFLTAVNSSPPDTFLAKKDSSYRHLQDRKQA